MFDKTGTLTGPTEGPGHGHGKRLSEQKAWQVIYAMEQGSDHYIAHTISAYGVSRNIPLLELEDVNYHDNGISCRFQDESYCFGSMDFMNKSLPEGPSFVSFSRQDAQIITTVFICE